jgi:ATP/maltotriose-dependent transcriptional regulator MalT
MDIAKNTQQFAMPSMSSYALQQFDSITHAVNTPLSPEMAISRARAGAELKNSFPEYDVKEIVQLAKKDTGESNTDHSANSSTDSREQYDVSQNNVIEDILHTVLEADTAAIQREMLAASDNLLYQEAIKIGTDFLSTYAGSISKHDESIISILIARLSITIGDTESALFFIKEVKNLLAKNPDTLISCLYHNAKASLHLSEQDFNSAWRELQNAANESSNLGYEYQLLTISNISILLAKGNKPSDAVKYRKAAKSLGKALKLQGFLEHLKKFS